MINIAPGILGVYFANLYPWSINPWWIHSIVFLVLSFIGGTLFFYNFKESSRIFNYNSKNILLLDNRFEGFINFYANIGKYMKVGIIPIILLYFGTLEFLSGNIYTISISFLIIFFIFIWLAYGYSLQQMKDLVPVDIHFMDKERAPLVEVMILKFNEDNVRVRVENIIYIINKSEIFTIQMKIPKKLL
jgi:hypothetical protein